MRGTSLYSTSLLTSIAIGLLAAAVGCNSQAASTNSTPSADRAEFSGSYPIQAVATIGMVGDIVRNVGGEHVQVEQICGSGVDPHLYKPTRDDVLTISSADIVFYCGLMLEGKMEGTLASVGKTKPVHAVTE